MPSLFPIEECDMDRLYEIEQAAHLVPWSLGTLKNNVGERYLNLKLVEKEQVLGFAICQTVLDEDTLFNRKFVTLPQNSTDESHIIV